jgi:hypothetical protein
MRRNPAENRPSRTLPHRSINGRGAKIKAANRSMLTAPAFQSMLLCNRLREKERQTLKSENAAVGSVEWEDNP